MPYALRRFRQKKKANAGIISQPDWKPVLEQPPDGYPSDARPPCAPPAPAGISMLGALQPVVVQATLSLPRAWRMRLASSARAESMAAGVLVAWYVLGKTPWAILSAWSPRPSDLALFNSS